MPDHAYHPHRSPPLPEVLYSMLGPSLCDAIAHSGAPRAEEIRLHVGRVLTVTCAGSSYQTPFLLSGEEMEGIFRRMCDFSLYTHRHTICQGYLSLPGGIRVGISGHAAIENQSVVGIRPITGLVLRIPQVASVQVDTLLPHFFGRDGSLRNVLLYSSPGVGKTTLLSALARILSASPYELRTVVVDSREEMEARLVGSRLHLDVLSGFPRALGMEMAIRSLGAQLLVCDEIGNEGDADAIQRAVCCGVALLASAHAATEQELLARPLLRALIEQRVFDVYVGIQRSKQNEMRYRISSCSELLSDPERILAPSLWSSS